ncbi:hypothetical protein Tco_0661579, partial [Tanacetum coccineum]
TEKTIGNRPRIGKVESLDEGPEAKSRKGPR